MLVVESDGRVRTVEPLRSETRLGKDKAAANAGPAPAKGGEAVLRELVFHPGAGTRRLTVAVR